MTRTFQLQKPDLCGSAEASQLTTALLCRGPKYAATLCSRHQAPSARTTQFITEDSQKSDRHVSIPRTGRPGPEPRTVSRSALVVWHVPLTAKRSFFTSGNHFPQRPSAPRSIFCLPGSWVVWRRSREKPSGCGDSFKMADTPN